MTTNTMISANTVFEDSLITLVNHLLSATVVPESRKKLRTAMLGIGKKGLTSTERMKIVDQYLYHCYPASVNMAHEEGNSQTSIALLMDACKTADMDAVLAYTGYDPDNIAQDQLTKLLDRPTSAAFCKAVNGLAADLRTRIEDKLLNDDVYTKHQLESAHLLRGYLSSFEMKARCLVRDEHAAELKATVVYMLVLDLHHVHNSTANFIRTQADDSNRALWLGMVPGLGEDIGPRHTYRPLPTDITAFRDLVYRHLQETIRDLAPNENESTRAIKS